MAVVWGVRDSGASVVARRRNDGPWRRECLQRRGAFCRACGYSYEPHLQIDHIKPRSQLGPSVVENGLVLCGPFGRGCHDRKTNSSMLIERDWLDDDQIVWLAETGWVEWINGEPHGLGWRHFARLKEYRVTETNLADAATEALEGTGIAVQEHLPGTNYAKVKFKGMGWETVEAPDLREEVELVVKGIVVGHGQEVMADGDEREIVTVKVTSVVKKSDKDDPPF